ncbi:MAG: nuclear transport factor 2 family protein [Verrucomicrobia bacterium]|nr:nuclear transport factor 2 family protein [Verrucomicrobiota bacterium]
MKPTLLPIFVLFATVTLHAADDSRLAAVRAADDQRVAATLAADGKKLDAIFSDELRYAHSSGVVDTKTSYIQSIVSGRTKYHVIHFEERNFTFPAPGIALESGRAHMRATSPTGESDSIFSFLAVWRKEKGQWRFLAWQSCKLPPATPNDKAK